MEEEGWKKIGSVCVDSGQLLICDPCYIGSSWVERDVEWEDKLRVVKTGKEIPSPRKLPGKTFESEYQDGKTYNQAIKEGILEEVPEKETGEFSYDGCCRGTINKGYASLDGSGVAFSSGFGDGEYEVWAKFENHGNWGMRIAEVKIKLI